MPTRVIVVGAGVAGLTAAHRLQSAGRSDGIWGAGMAVYPDSGGSPSQIASATAVGTLAFDADSVLEVLGGPDPSLEDGFAWFVENSGLDPAWRNPVSAMLASSPP